MGCRGGSGTIDRRGTRVNPFSCTRTGAQVLVPGQGVPPRRDLDRLPRDGRPDRPVTGPPPARAGPGPAPGSQARPRVLRRPVMRSPLVQAMIEASRAGARVLLDSFAQLPSLTVSEKGPSDFVSQADLRSEATIKAALTAFDPGARFQAEESEEGRASTGPSLHHRPPRRHHQLPPRHPPLRRHHRLRRRGRRDRRPGARSLPRRALLGRARRGRLARRSAPLHLPADEAPGRGDPHRRPAPGPRGPPDLPRAAPER